MNGRDNPEYEQHLASLQARFSAALGRVLMMRYWCIRACFYRHFVMIRAIRSGPRPGTPYGARCRCRRTVSCI